MNDGMIFLYVILGAVCIYILANVVDAFLLERRLNRTSKLLEKRYKDSIRTKTIDEMESRILENCSAMCKDGERIIVIRSDIFGFIIEQMKEGAENGEH